MSFNLQPTHLENEKFKLVPLTENDFEKLYKIASDPLIWEQHPNPNRYKREVFMNFFSGAIEMGGSLLILDKSSGEVIGTSRFYDVNEEVKFIVIGYTFYNRDYWGTNANKSVKKLMLDYAFESIERVHFHIGFENIRSQIAIQRIGAKKVGEMEVAYFGEEVKHNFVFEIVKNDYVNSQFFLSLND